MCIIENLEFRNCSNKVIKVSVLTIDNLDGDNYTEALCEFIISYKMNKLDETKDTKDI